MRLIVLEIHRAFEELDPFTDEQCRGYVRDAYAQSPGVIRGYTVLGLLAAVFLVVASMPLSVAALAYFQDIVWDQWSIWPPLAVFVPTIAWWFFCAWSAFAMRDAGLRRAIARRLAGARCSTCAYSLLGLTVTDGAVTCPECGHTESLHARGLSAADILAPNP